MNDIQIIRGVKGGNEAAINYAINKYSKLMWHIAGTVLKNVTSAEDIEECVADVFIYLWKNPHKFDEQRGNLKSWLSSVAKSKGIIAIGTLPFAFVGTDTNYLLLSAAR